MSARALPRPAGRASFCAAEDGSPSGTEDESVARWKDGTDAAVYVASHALAAVAAGLAGGWKAALAVLVVALLAGLGTRLRRRSTARRDVMPASATPPAPPAGGGLAAVLYPTAHAVRPLAAAPAPAAPVSARRSRAAREVEALPAPAAPPSTPLPQDDVLLDEKRRAVLVVEAPTEEPVWRAVEEVLDLRTRRWKLVAQAPGQSAGRYEYRVRLKRKVRAADLAGEVRAALGGSTARVEIRPRGEG